MKIPQDLYFIISNDQTIYMLIDSNSDIIGYCHLVELSEYYEIIDFATEKGYGVFFCDCLMLFLDMPINPSINLTPDFFNIWKKYYTMRPDVEKIINTDKEKFVYLQHHNNKEETLSDELSLNIVNHSYIIYDRNKSKIIKEWYEQSLLFEEQKENEISNWKKIMINKGKLFFRKKYHI